LSSTKKVRTPNIPLRLPQEETKYPARLSSPAIPKLEGGELAEGKKQITFAPEIRFRDDHYA